MITHMQYVAVPVSDPHAALVFYTETLGFERVAYDSPASPRGVPWVVVRPPRAETHLALIRSTSPHTRCPVVLFATDDLEQTYRDLLDRGVRFVQAPAYNTRGTAILEDPDGNRLVLTSQP